MTTYVGWIRPAAVPAWQALSAALDDVDSQVPCKASPDTWCPETADLERITYAENHCRTVCPVLTQCAAYADAGNETGAVWGGSYRPTRAGRPAQPDTHQERLFS